MHLWHYELSSAMGPLRAAFDGRGRLHELALGGLDPRKTSPLPPKEQREAKRFLDLQLEAYLAGCLRTFTVPLDPQGTFVELRVWDALLAIPYGQVTPLDELADRLRLDSGAVVAACAANPIAVLIPDHRVPREGDGPMAVALRELEAGQGWRR
jgi:O6-methylguanine-DNA--protein-cysteine methyltransferase